MEDHRVPSFVQYPQKRKRTISDAVNTSVRTFKRREQESFMGRSGSCLVDETDDVMQYFTTVNEETIGTVVPHVEEKMDVEENEVTATAVTTAPSDIKATAEKEKDAIQEEGHDDAVAATAQKELDTKPTTITTVQKFRDEAEMKQYSIEATLDNKITTSRTDSTAETHDKSKEGSLRKVPNSDVDKQERSAGDEDMDRQVAVDKSSSAVEKLVDNKKEEPVLSSTHLNGTTTTTTRITVQNDIIEATSTTENKNITVTKTSEDTEKQNGSSLEEETVGDNIESVLSSEDVSMETNHQQTNGKELTNQLGSDEESIEETKSTSSSTGSLQEIKSTPWLSSIWKSFTSPFRSKK